MAKKIIAIVGMPGSGKSEVAEYFVNKKFAYIRLGQLTLNIVKAKKLKQSETNERKIREQLRKKHGMAAYALLNFSKIDEIKDNLVIDGLYSWEEYVAFKKKYPKIIIIAVYSSPMTRYKRLWGRAKKHGSDPNLKYRSFSLAESKSRDRAEIENLNKGGPIAMADFTLVNESNKKDLKRNLDKIFISINAQKN